MEKLLQEISVIPGVSGSCIFNKKRGALCKDLHQDLTEENVETVGVHMLRLLQMGSMADLAISSSHFRFDRYTVIGIPLDADAILMTICDSQANCSLVATTATMLAADLRDDLQRGLSPTTTTEPKPESKAGNNENGEEDTFIQLQLDEVEQALAGAIGPVATVVMQDYLDRWREEGPITSARIPELAEMLLQEIGNPELARNFSERIKSIL